MTETGKSNYPVATPMGAQLTEEVVRDMRPYEPSDPSEQDPHRLLGAS